MDFIAAKMTVVVVTTGAIRCAKLQSNCHHQQTNTQLFVNVKRYIPRKIAHLCAFNGNSASPRPFTDTDLQTKQIFKKNVFNINITPNLPFFSVIILCGKQTIVYVRGHQPIGSLRGH